jgi:uncharacterized repeat protein (TIGR03943 family)
MWHNVRAWSGVVLALVVTVATVWLAASGQLVLYIHPRYVVFTVIMAVLALAVGIASFVARPAHDHEEPVRGWEKGVSIAAVALSVVIALALVIVPPTTLTSATVEQRAINSTGVGADVKSLQDVADDSNAAFAKFTVRDWASLLAQSSDPAFYDGKPADVVGFVTADPDDPENVFYVSRFIVTCCAVDAQPVGVPVYSPNWQGDYPVDGWVQVTGEFASNPSSESAQAIALVPTSIETTGTPSAPYLF